MYKLNDVINGILLGDGSIRSQNSKYFSFKIVGKDKKFIKWLEILFNKFGIKCWISQDNQDIFALWFYINTCPYESFISLRKEWYKKENGKTLKILPKNLELTPTTVLFWYLGDGCLVRRKNDENRVPFIVLATNCFSKGDINVLIKKLKELGLNFYPIKYRSGFNKGKECGYCLYSNTEDGTPLRFFKLIGLECPREIANCSTGAKGIYHEEKFFKNKWPTEVDWIKILSNIKVGYILRQKRFELRLSQNQLGSKVGIRRENIRDVELMKRNFNVSNFRKILNALDLDVNYLLTQLN